MTTETKNICILLRLIITRIFSIYFLLIWYHFQVKCAFRQDSMQKCIFQRSQLLLLEHGIVLTSTCSSNDKCHCSAIGIMWWLSIADIFLVWWRMCSIDSHMIYDSWLNCRKEITFQFHRIIVSSVNRS